MRQRRHYALAFLLVLLAAVGGAWLGWRLIRPVEVPQLDVVASLQEVVAGVDINALIPRRIPTTGSATQPGPTGTAASPASPATGEPASLPLPVESVTGTVAAGEAPTPIPTPAAPAVEDTPTLTPVASPIPSPTPASIAFAFLPAGAVRHTADGCPGAAIRGVARDAAGNPLPGVRLWRYDQYGNEQTVETKSGSTDLGQYDFVLGDTPNVHYVQVVDVGGSPISPRLEVQHRQGDAADAMCHTLDWISQ